MRLLTESAERNIFFKCKKGEEQLSYDCVVFERVIAHLCVYMLSHFEHTGVDVGGEEGDKNELKDVSYGRRKEKKTI